MEARALDQDGKTFVVIFASGDEPVAGLPRFAQERGIGASSFTAIGP
jgi:predicted DNA-binding protein with PD1-like motif